MEPHEIDRIFRLLQQYYQNAAALKSKDFRAAWSLSLKKFVYSDVRDRIVEYATHVKYFPDLYDITDGLLEVEDKAEKINRQARDMATYLIKMYEERGRLDLADRVRKAALKEKLK